MRKLIAAVIAASVVVLGGCSSTPAPVVIEVPQTQSIEDKYISVIETQTGPLDSTGRTNFIDLGKTICAALDDGAGFDEVLLAAMAGGMTPEMSGFVTGASVGAFCPVHTAEMERFAASYSTYEA